MITSRDRNHFLCCEKVSIIFLKRNPKLFSLIAYNHKDRVGSLSTILIFSIARFVHAWFHEVAGIVEWTIEPTTV